MIKQVSNRTYAILKMFKDHVYCYAIFIKIHVPYSVLGNLLLRSFLGRGMGRLSERGASFTFLAL